jgi:hypothetical protein
MNEMNWRMKKEELTYIGIELTNEAGEIVMLEIGWKKNASEFRGIPNDETVIGRAPRNDLICAGIVHHIIRFLKKRRRTSSVSGSGGR